MANSQVTTRDTQLEKQRIGLLRLSMTNFGNTSEPAIAAGSVVEIGGSLFVFTSNEAITGWGAIGNDTDCYIRLPYNGALTAEFTTVAPTWSASKQGWYDGIKRYVAGLHRGASAAAYEDKWVYQRSQDNNASHRFYGDGTVDVDAGIKGNLPVGGYFEMNGVALKYKVLEIGVWNMDSTANVLVAHGITGLETKLRMISVIIKANAGEGDLYRLADSFVGDGGEVAGRITFIDDTNISLQRTLNEWFDGTPFDDGNNRGWVTIWYEE